MTNRAIVRGLLVTAVITVALWAVSAGRAISQECDGPCPPPPGVVLCPPPVEGFSTCFAPFTTENDSWTYFYDANNSIKITTPVDTPFVLQVDLRAIDPVTEYPARVALTPFAGSTCWPTSLTPPGDCVVYRVHGEVVSPSFYGPMVEYILGFTTPAIPDNKHDMMLLRSSTMSSPTPYPALNSSFDQEITSKVIRNYGVGEDPGVGGDANGFSDYIVAYQRIRPASK